MLELATPADREAIEGMARQLYGQLTAWRPDLYTLPETLYDDERISRERTARQLYTAKIGGQTIGYIRLRFAQAEGPSLIPRKRMIIEEFCVDEPYRDQGFGSEMMQGLLILARAFRCGDLQLGVLPQNDPAVGFWQKCGFTIKAIEMQRSV